MALSVQPIVVATNPETNAQANSSVEQSAAPVVTTPKQNSGTGYWDKNGYPVGRLMVNYMKYGAQTGMSYEQWIHQRV